jgi:diguanylate cyclase (GGDEF)-like protein/PAS domain S-box-containing protein
MQVAPSLTSPLGSTTVKFGRAPEQADQLIQARLGIYAGLFYALRAKHPPTAAHGLRVAVGCSKWALWSQMPADQRQLLEVAALLHDVGKIGIPDRILQKPTQLDSQEQLLMDMQTTTAIELLHGSGANQQLIDIVRFSRDSFQLGGELQPIASRMLAVVDAFDSMTTEQVFRKALSRERAVDELFQYAGSQFDPHLVHSFADMISQPRPQLEAEVAKGWLAQFSPDVTPGFTQSSTAHSCGALQNVIDTVFHQRLLDTLPDAAVYLDLDGQILLWNRTAERMTGRLASTMNHHTWTAAAMGLLTDHGCPLSPEQCPLQMTFKSNTQYSERLQLRHVDGRTLNVNATSIPVCTRKGEITGAILIIRDTSAQVHLEERVQSLHAIASQDNLTQVSNRAEMDRRLPAFLQVHTMAAQPGSLIICDIDHFKRINDTYGHQAGDEALVTFASVLRECSRDGDLVARYGGEEFVLLCAACDNPTATARAEEIRRMVERTPVPALGGNSMTASFGVTENQPGDTAATFLARADRALLTAKATGRNRVVQLGAGQDPETPTAAEAEACGTSHSSWLSWFRPRQEITILKTERLASVPPSLAVQKLEGFISDHRAEVLEIEPYRVVLRINGQRSEAARRQGERQATMLMEVTIIPVDYRIPRTNSYQSKTKLDIVIRSVNPRDRRQTALLGQANQLLFSFNSYLVGQVITDEMRAANADYR